MSIFHINERAILLPPRTGAISLLASSYVGTQVIVISELTPVSELTTLNVREKHGYLVALFDGHVGWVVPHLLQKLPPPSPDWRSMAMRDDLIARERPAVRATHPAIESMLQFIGQGSR